MKEVAQILKQVFPPYLLALVNFSVIVGLFINHNLVDSREFVLNFIWILIFTISFNVFKSKPVYRITIVVYFIISLIETLHWLILKGPLTTTSLIVISATNFNESLGFLSLKIGTELLMVFPLIILLWIGLKKPPTFSSSKKRNYILFGCSLLVIIFIGENILNNRFIRQGTPNFIKVTATFLEKITLYQEAAKQQFPKAVNASTIEKEQTFVLVLGESSNRNHMGIYNPSINTTPRLKKRKDLYLFTDVVSGYSNTINSVLNSLSESNLDNNLLPEKSFDLLDIFYSAGYKTFWLSNQPPVGLWENPITIFANKSDQKVFINIASNSSLEATSNPSYDEKLFTPFINALNKEVSKKFIVIHLMGNHTKYRRRYPRSYNIFKGKNDKEQTIAEYHNSIYYNDFIVDSLITILENSNQKSSLIYLSDHGENVYDYQDKIGHDYSGSIPKANVEIPFIIWCSDKYKKAFSIKVKTIELNKLKPFVSDNLFHTIIDMNNIETDYYKKSLSNVNAGYSDTRLRILEDGENYDRK